MACAANDGVPASAAPLVKINDWPTSAKNARPGTPRGESGDKGNPLRDMHPLYTHIALPTNIFLFLPFSSPLVCKLSTEI